MSTQPSFASMTSASSSSAEWSLDTIRMIVRDGEIEMRISHQQCEVLTILIDALPHPVPASEIASKAFLGPDVVKVIVRRLRRRIGANRIFTNSGGYEFVPFPGGK